MGGIGDGRSDSRCGVSINALVYWAGVLKAVEGFSSEIRHSFALIWMKISF